MTHVMKEPPGNASRGKFDECYVVTSEVFSFVGFEQSQKDAILVASLARACHTAVAKAGSAFEFWVGCK